MKYSNIILILLLSSNLMSCSISEKKVLTLYAYDANINQSQYNQVCLPCTHTINDAGVIAFSQYWKIIYNPNQAYLGRVVLVSKRHFSDYESMTNHEIREYQEIFKILLPALQKAFDVTHFNVAYLMNMAYNNKHPEPKYSNGKPSPHFHWHIIPRYNSKREFTGELFTDPDFGDTFNFKRKQYLLGGFRQKAIKSIQNLLPIRYLMKKNGFDTVLTVKPKTWVE